MRNNILQYSRKDIYFRETLSFVFVESQKFSQNFDCVLEENILILRNISQQAKKISFENILSQPNANNKEFVSDFVAVQFIIVFEHFLCLTQSLINKVNVFKPASLMVKGFESCRKIWLNIHE